MRPAKPKDKQKATGQRTRRKLFSLKELKYTLSAALFETQRRYNSDLTNDELSKLNNSLSCLVGSYNRLIESAELEKKIETQEKTLIERGLLWNT